MLHHYQKKDRAPWIIPALPIPAFRVLCANRGKTDALQSILRPFAALGNGKVWVDISSLDTREGSAIGAHFRHRGTWAFRSRAVDMVMQNGSRPKSDAPKTLNKCSVAKQNTEQKFHWIGVQWEKFAYLIENQFSTGSIFPRGRARARAHV